MKNQLENYKIFSYEEGRKIVARTNLKKARLKSRGLEIRD